MVSCIYIILAYKYMRHSQQRVFDHNLLTITCSCLLVYVRILFPCPLVC